MNLLKLNFLFVTVLFLIQGCNSTTSSESEISGKVVFLNSTNPVPYADVYIFSNHKQLFMGDYNFEKKISADSNGRYSFKYDKDNRYYLYSEYTGSDFKKYCGQKVYVDTPDNSSSLAAENINMYEVQNFSNLQLTFTSEVAGVDTDSISVVLQKLQGAEYVDVDSFVTTAEPQYLLENMETGYYMLVYEKTTYHPDLHMIFTFSNTNELPFVNGVNNVQASASLLGDNSVDKPVIYIYPEIAGQFEISLSFKDGVNLTESIPQYNDGWKVFIDDKGRIDNTYDFLFYEAALPGNQKFEKGYCFASDQVYLGIKQLLIEIGMNDREISDFLDYWQSRLNDYPFYNVCPITNSEIDNFVSLHITPVPDAVLRIWLFFEGTNQKENLIKPSISKFVRGKTTVVEWGGVMLN
ncbi:MAG: hypothetical protein PHR06_12655 [Candidatus Cloacimonetes bacterium]|nr:hypothetical protein [Candidatus Cloacimonadota bacterium]